MFKFTELESIHLEISNRCQASCPMCPRNIHSGIENPSLKINDWSYDDFVRIISPEVLSQIKELNFCGSFGDPMMNNDLIRMCEYVKATAPNTIVGIHTNGSLRSTKWWQELANALPVNHVVEFALDGLADTQALYRVGTDWHKIIKNAQTFMAAGGTADWLFIRFKHNEHQVAEAERIANELGFKRFRIKDTRRFETAKFSVVDKNGNTLYYLEPPTTTSLRFVNRADLEDYNNWANKTKIDCFALRQKEIYIDACYTVMPCCILAAFIYTNYDKSILKQNGLYHELSNVDIGGKIQMQVFDIIEELGGKDYINATRRTVKDIVDDTTWQTIWHKKWKSAESSACIALCSVDSPFGQIDDQKITYKE